MAKVELQGAPEPFHLLNRIPIHECREPLVDIREACPRVLLRPGTLPYLRRSVAAMLNRANDELPPGYRYVAHTALRTLEMQSSMYWRNFNKLKEEKPQLPLSALRRITNKYFAPPDAKAPPGHTTGGAVDVGLVGPDFRVIDMIAPTKNWEAAYTWSDLIGPETKKNRMLLVQTLLAVGFSNCRDEWWHYSYGDNAWAVRTGCAIAMYGQIAPPDGYTFVARPPAEMPPRPGYRKVGPQVPNRRTFG